MSKATALAEFETVLETLELECLGGGEMPTIQSA